MLLASAAFLLLISISHVSSHPKPHIAAGEGKPTVPHQYPWMVRVDAVDDIFVDPDTNKIESYTGRLCGATLIPAYGRTEDSDIVLTAAHCLVEVEPRKLETGEMTLDITSKPIPSSKRRLVAGAHSISSLTEPGSQVRQIARMEFHPKWRSAKMDEGHDIALIKLDKPVKFTDTIKSIALPGKGDRPKDSCVIAGWGKINSKESPKVLYHMNVTIKDDCQFSRETGYCVDADGSSVPTACGGDSGGPLFCKRQAEWVQYGLLSYGRGNCERGIVNTPSVYMNTEVYLDWINEKVREWSSV